MPTRVTAVLVAQHGGEWLEQTIAAITGQTHKPTVIVAVNNGGSDQLARQLQESGADRVVGLTSSVSFGRAVAAGIAAIHTETTPSNTHNAPQEWVWLLSEDSCPEPHALERIVHSVQRAPSVAVAGPKLVDWDHPEHIIELGQSLTRFGSRWLLRRQELDQQQYDHLQDVLGVGPVGMLVRSDVWHELGGFDPALPVYDDGLDFCVRARLAGHRVEVAPASRVRFAQSGVAGPRIDRKRSVMRVAHRQARTAQLHRRISYAPAIVALFQWLGLPLLAFARVFWALIREQPGNMLGEFLSAFTVFFRPGAILASRGRITRVSTAGWAAIRPLRVEPKVVRTARMIDREAILAAEGRTPRELHFVSSGGLAVLTTATVLSLALTWWALSQTSMIGGGIAPLSGLDELWWNTRSLDGVPADPFTWVLAALGTFTFWNPSHALVLLLIAAIPLTALGGWIWAAQLSQSKAARALLALGFALSPVMLGSIASGRITTLVLSIVLPWLLISATRCRQSWSQAGTTSILAAVALAAAPILIPAAIVLLVVGLFTTVRGIARLLTTALVPAVLFAPKIIDALVHGTGLDLLLDPGVITPFQPGSIWHMLLGFPEFGLHGWADILASIGVAGAPVTLAVGVLMLLVALLALLGLFTARLSVSVLSSLLGGLGILTALAAAQLRLFVVGDESVSLWTGSGLAVYWIALLSLAAVGADALRRGAAPVVTVALVSALLAVVPSASGLFWGHTLVRPGSTELPAIVQAAGERSSALRTLVITVIGEHAVRAGFVNGSGTRLDSIRTAASVPVETEQDVRVTEIVAGLVSVGGADAAVTALHEQGVGFVLLSSGGDEGERAKLQRLFDQHAAIVSTGVTDQGLLWRVVHPDISQEGVGDEHGRLGDTSLTGQMVWVVQLLVLLGVVLLSLPTGEIVARPERRKRPRRGAGRVQVAAQSEQPAPENVASHGEPSPEGGPQ